MDLLVIQLREKVQDSTKEPCGKRNLYSIGREREEQFGCGILIEKKRVFQLPLDSWSR
jgi:hypothetical protein